MKKASQYEATIGWHDSPKCLTPSTSRLICDDSQIGPAVRSEEAFDKEFEEWFGFDAHDDEENYPSVSGPSDDSLLKIDTTPPLLKTRKYGRRVRHKEVDSSTSSDRGSSSDNKTSDAGEISNIKEILSALTHSVSE
ncbi:hypothetical protein AB6A40_005408 [Gnathostoma spinigerum]|uniref:Uncharacterized protein n=1 Tax=Gnathostoma spinigerum TaxID=75299 RepID=A0ABD6EKL6_9BILA